MNTRHAPAGAIANLIALTAVASSRITSIGYDGEQQILAVGFPPKTTSDEGSLYHYYDVPAAVFESFAKADSKGSFFEREIRRKYDYRKIEPDVGDVNVMPRANQGAANQDAADGAQQGTQETQTAQV